MVANGDLMKHLYEAFAKGDLPSVLGSFDLRIEWREAESLRYADRSPYVGPQAIAEGVFHRVISDVDGFRVNPSNVIDAGDTVVVEGRYTGRSKATGTTIDAEFCHLWELKAGKVVRFRLYTDTAQWARALG